MLGRVAVARVDLQALEVVAGDDVDHPTKGVGAIQRGGGSADDLDALDFVQRRDVVELVAAEVRRLSEDGTIITPIRVANFSTLLTDFAREQGASVIVRGLRAVSDFEIEFQMASINKRLHGDLETVFLMAAEHQHFVASRFVKEVSRFGGDISSFVPASVVRKMRDVNAG